MITVLPDRTETGDPIFRAVLGERIAVGRTVGTAVDALAEELETDGSSETSLSSTVIWVQRFQADPFFTEAQRERMTTLMTMWRTARDAGMALMYKEQNELEALVEAETIAMTERTEALLERRR